MKIETSKRFSFKKAFLSIVFSTLLISGTAGIALLYYFQVKEIQLCHPRYNISSIAKIGKESGSLSTPYLTELLGLSVDNPVNLFAFKTDQALARVLTSPWINKAQIWKILPDTLAIEYSVRKPFLRLLDFENAAIDSEGVIFPCHLEPPIPALYLGNLEESVSWGSKIDLERVTLITQILDEANKRKILLNRIDLSKIEAPSFGDRQLVLVLSEPYKWILRLRAQDLNAQFNQLVGLLKYSNTHPVESSGKIIDLRVPHLAFMQDL